MSGLLLQEDFSAANGWIAGTGFSRVADPALITFGELPSPLLQPRGAGSADVDGVRDSQLFIEGSAWSMIYDGGDGVTGWREFLATSTDRGLTWTRAFQSIGYDNGSSGTWPATANGWLEKRGSTYHLHRFTAASTFPSPNIGLPGQPYTADQWSASAIDGTWTFGRRLETQGGWANTDINPGSVVLDSGTYYYFIEGAASDWKVGVMTGSSPFGPWTFNGTPIFTSANFDGSRLPENPKVFYHTGLSRWVMLMNLINSDGTHTDRNCVALSSSITDWSGATKYYVQRALAPCDTTGNAVGIPCHVTGPDGTLISEAGYVPMLYDADPRAASPGWHLGRSIRTTVLEPSAYRLAYADATATRHRYSKSLSHTDFVAEFIVDFSVFATGGDLSFEFRTDGTSGYRLVVPGDFALTRLRLEKMDGTAIQTNTTGTAVIEPYIEMRIRVSAVGNQIDAWIDGEHQINVTDSTYASGTQIAFSGHTVTGNTRLFHMRNSATLTIRGLPASQTINVRSFGGLPVSQISSDGSGVGAYIGTHFPISRIEVPNKGDAQTPDLLLWGGDDVSVFDGSSRIRL